MESNGASKRLLTLEEGLYTILYESNIFNVIQELY